jgi:hypothetical protein
MHRHEPDDAPAVVNDAHSTAFLSITLSTESRAEARVWTFPSVEALGGSIRFLDKLLRQTVNGLRVAGGEGPRVKSMHARRERAHSGDDNLTVLSGDATHQVQVWSRRRT